jgi:hypothetical protein
MEKIMEVSVKEPAQFDISRTCDPDKYRAEFSRTGRARINGFLQPHDAEALYQHLRHHVVWRSFLVANGQLLGTPQDARIGGTSDEEREIVSLAYDGARNGFAYLYDADRLFPEDESDGAPVRGDVKTPILADSSAFLSGSRFMEFVRGVTGLPELETVHSQAVRFRPGHFVTFQSGTWSADKTGRRRVSFFLNLTPAWKPEWGGLIEFRAADGSLVEALVPCFNVLDVFTFPKGYWVSCVAPFAGGPRFDISGRVYAA